MSDQYKKQEKLKMFLEWLEQDAENPSLLTDCVDAAIDADELEQAENLLRSFGEKQTLTPEMQNLLGVTLLRKGQHQDASELFDKLVSDGHDDEATRFNLAWTYALSDEKGKALSLINDEMAQTLPQAASLRVQMLHGSGQFEEAMDQAKGLSDIHPDDPGLMAAMSVLALDLEDPELAKACAEKAPVHPDAITTLATLELGEHNIEAAQQQFAQALSINDRNPRAWIGQGLTKLSSGQNFAALRDFDKGAELFGSHIGSWIASGWAYFLNDDKETSRQRFEKALELDGSFAESHGSLAVLDIIDGNVESAEKRCETALRLDRDCFSAALAKSLILQAQGDSAKAERIVQMAMKTPIDASGKTLADNLIQMGGIVPNDGSSTVH